MHLCSLGIHCSFGEPVPPPGRYLSTRLRSGFLASSASLLGLLGQNLQEFKKMVEAETKGRAQVSIYDNASFYLDYQVPEAAQECADLKWRNAMVQHTDEIPLAVVPSPQPFLFNFGAIVRLASARGSEIRVADRRRDRKEGGGQGTVVAALDGQTLFLARAAWPIPKAIAGHTVPGVR